MGGQSEKDRSRANHPADEESTEVVSVPSTLAGYERLAFFPMEVFCRDKAKKFYSTEPAANLAATTQKDKGSGIMSAKILKPSQQATQILDELFLTDSLVWKMRIRGCKNVIPASYAAVLGAFSDPMCQNRCHVDYILLRGERKPCSSPAKSTFTPHLSLGNGSRPSTRQSLASIAVSAEEVKRSRNLPAVYHTILSSRVMLLSLPPNGCVRLGHRV